MIGLAAAAFQTSRAAARPGIRVCSIEQRLAGRSMCDCGTPLATDAPGDCGDRLLCQPLGVMERVLTRDYLGTHVTS